MMFSERYGFKSVREQLQVDDMDSRLKNALWNVYYKYFIDNPKNNNLRFWEKYTTDLWVRLWHFRLDTVPKTYYGINDHLDISGVKEMISEIFHSDAIIWYEVYDFIEFSAPYEPYSIQSFNEVLEREKSGYRLINNKIVKITSDTEIISIEEALDSTYDNDRAINTHLKTALELLANREKPDYRNSIKESISAVEALCRKVAGNEKATLGQALNLLAKNRGLHPALNETFKKLYGYTNDEGGIRHAITEDSKEPDFNDAKFMLVTCSAFINYVVGKLN